LPLGEAKSNWDVMRLLAAGMGYNEPWLQQAAEEAIAEVLDATRAQNPLLEGITLERLQAEGTVALHFPPERHVPFADLRFPTPSGKIELRCEALAQQGLDPLPNYVPPAEFQKHFPNVADETSQDALSGRDEPGQTFSTHNTSLVLISGASHHFVSSSLANVSSLLAKEGEPFVEINPQDACARGIANGDEVIVENTRGWCQLRAVVTDNVPPGVAVAPKGRWGRIACGGRNINWTTSDALADLAGQSTFHSNLVEIRRASVEST
jgi:anaerobic selenocysteine-containing dehydrogenase